jgi:hypothetical protein
MRSLATLLLSLIVASPWLATPPQLAAASDRFATVAHDAAGVSRVQVAGADGSELPDTVAARSSWGPLPARTVTAARSRSGVPSPELILGPADVAATGDGSGTASTGSSATPFFSAGFPGMNDTVNGFDAGCAGVPRPCIEPPDPWVAAGPSHIVQAVNVALRITDRVGSGATTMALSTFFAEPPGQVNADPRVLYDATKGRWLATELSFDCTAGRLYLAVSDGADPTGTWTVWNFVFAGSLPDYPGLGMSSDKVLLGVNLFPIIPDGSPLGCSIGSFTGASLLVVDWTDIADGGALAGLEFGPNPSLFTWRPAAAQSPGCRLGRRRGPEFGFSDVGLATVTDGRRRIRDQQLPNLTEDIPRRLRAAAPAAPARRPRGDLRGRRRPTDRRRWRSGRL